MRKFVFLLFMVFAMQNQLEAQSVKDTVINGKKHFIYPYKIEYAKRDKNNDIEIPPVMEVLPDGDYVLIVKKKKKETPRVYFSIKDNKFSGKASFYSQKGKLLREGSYTNGLEEGQWISYHKNGQVFYETTYLSGKHNGYYKSYDAKGVLRTEGLYVMGNKEGAWKIYDDNGNIDKTESYSAGKANGEWKIYFENGDLHTVKNYKSGLLHGTIQYYHYFHESKKKEKHYLRREVTIEKGKINGLVKMYYFSTIKNQAYLGSEFYFRDTTSLNYYESEDGSYEPVFMSDSDFNTFYKYYKTYYVNGNLEMEAYSDTVTFLETQTIDSYLQRSNNYAIFSGYAPLAVPFTLHHPNGKLLGEFKPTHFENPGPFHVNNDFDSIFYSNGKPFYTKQYISDSLEKKRFIFNHYDTSGVLNRIDYYVVDSIFNHYSVYKSITCGKSGICELEQIDNDYFLTHQLPFLKQDSIYLLSYRYGEYRYLCPLAPGLVLLQNKKNYNPKIDFEIVQYGNPFIAKKTILFDDLKFVAYHSVDSTTSGPKLTIGDITPGGYFYGGLGRELGNADSILVYNKNEPFTGTIKVKGDGKDERIKMHKNVITFDPDIYYKLNDKAQLYCKNGQIIKFKSQSHNLWEDSYKEMHFANHLYDGAHSIERKVRFEKNILIIENYSKGKENGEFTIWKGNHKKYISDKKQYANGIMTEHTSFYKDGTPQKTTSLDASGQKNGPEITYFENGKIVAYQTFKNDLTDGLNYSLDESGDTNSIMHFKEGNLHGNYYTIILVNTTRWNRSSKNTTPVDIHYLYASFNNNEIQSLRIYDHYKICRLKIKADSSVNFNYHINYFRNFNGWSELPLAGEVNLYHPNGNLYTQGKTIMKLRKLKRNQYGPEEEIYYPEKTGTWIYYNSTNRKINEINYLPILDIIGADTLQYIGDYKEFYPGGALKYKGKLILEQAKTECESDLQEVEFYFDAQYYFSENGDTILKNGTGKMLTFFKSGKLESEVEMVDGKYTGWYKEYNEEGKLVVVGKYIAGQKDGRWLAGDLTGIHYLDEGCFASPEFKENAQEKVKNEIKIEENRYENGELINSKSYYFTRSL